MIQEICEVQKTLYILVGNIASGKSTYLNDTEDDGVIISKDNIRKEFAKSVGKSYIYDEVLERNIHSIIEELTWSYCYLGTENIYIDETNMTVNGREMFIEIGKDYDYNIVAVVFPDLGEDTHIERRLGSNPGDTSEGVWRKVYRDKKEKYEEPSITEGIDEIIYVVG